MGLCQSEEDKALAKKNQAINRELQEAYFENVKVIKLLLLERKKWIHCFEGVHAIIFIAAISEFDQVLLEDAKTNRLMESTRLFAAICNSCWFIQTMIILFLNKTDLFLDKIKRKKSIKSCFEEYSGHNTYDDEIAYIEKKFLILNANTNKKVYIHHTCATDTNQVNLIMDNVVDSIIKKNLKGIGY
uniref:Uncharacterized protein n=1 Tax=Acrobeloides nanus TaxID=290746 RepID=A0A914D928_9BILA